MFFFTQAVRPGFKFRVSLFFPSFSHKSYTFLYLVLLVLKCRWRVALAAPKKFEFFHRLTKSECAAEMKITKLYALHFTSGPHLRSVDSSVARFTKKKRKTNGDYSRSIRRNRKSFHVTRQRGTSPATMSFSIVIIVFCCSSREGEKMRENVYESLTESIQVRKIENPETLPKERF